MKIVNLQQLREEPDGTVFACIKENYEAVDCLPLQVKGDSFKYNGGIHFNGLGYINPIPCIDQNIQDNVEYHAELFYYDGTDNELKDDGKNKFVVYSKKEIFMMIEALNDAIDTQNNFDSNTLFQI